MASVYVASMGLFFVCIKRTWPGPTAVQRQVHLQRKVDRSLRCRACNTFPERFAFRQRRHLDCAILIWMCVLWFSLSGVACVYALVSRTYRPILYHFPSVYDLASGVDHFLRFANRFSRKLRPCHLTMSTYRNLMLESGQTGNSTVKKMRSIAKGILFVHHLFWAVQRQS